MPVRAVTFDADDTLWDFSTAMRTGLGLAVDIVRDRLPDVGDRLALHDLAARWDRLHADLQAGVMPGVRLDELRGRSFTDALHDAGVEDPALVEQMVTAYFAHRHGAIGLFDGTVEVVAELRQQYVLGLVSNGSTDPERGPLAGVFTFRLAADAVGVRKPDPRMFAMAAAAAGCHPNELVHVGDHPVVDVGAAQAAGSRGVWLRRGDASCPPGVAPDATIDHLSDLPAVLARFDAEDALKVEAVGVGPHPEPCPTDPRFDRALLAAGDRRNVVDRYRYWSEAAIVADLAARARPFHVAVENWRHDRNIGAVVRNANAFGAAGVHIVGRRRWNRRGAMATDRYLPVEHHDDLADLLRWADSEELVLIGVDNVVGSIPIEGAELPERCVLLFGQEGPGLSAEARAACRRIVSITQHGSTRSINAGVASGIAMHLWVLAHPGGADR